MVPQPLPGDVSGAAGDDVNAPAGLGVDEHCRVDQAASQREVVDPEHPRHHQGGKGSQRTAAPGHKATYAAQHMKRYSITSSARASSVGGTSSPSALAVVRLMMKSNFVDCTTGRSAGLAPLRTRPL